MKKIVFFFVFLISIFSATFPKDVAWAENISFYAKVSSSGVMLCSSPTEASALFEIPQSYFVNVQYVVDDFYKVCYKSAEGYVKKDSVSLMRGTPQNPYANSTFNVFVPYNLYKSANQTSEVVAALNSSVSLEFYGTLKGEQLSEDSNTWFYTSATIGEQTYFGYVFSQISRNSPTKTIPLNTENFEIVSEELLDPSTNEFKSLSTGTKILLIVAISVPSVMILYFLIKPSKIMQITKSRKPSKTHPKRVRHGDYFEFDEKEL